MADDTLDDLMTRIVLEHYYSLMKVAFIWNMECKFSESQMNEMKELFESGDILKCQSIIIDELSKQNAG